MTGMTLEEAVTRHQDRGWRVVQRTERHVVLERGQRIPHGACIFFTFITGGLFGAVYGLLLLTSGLRTKQLQTDRHGKVYRSG